MIKNFGYVAAVSYPFGGDIYIYTIYTYDIRYPSLGGFFLGGNMQSVYVFLKAGN